MPVPTTYFRCFDCDEILETVEVHGGDDRLPYLVLRCPRCGPTKVAAPEPAVAKPEAERVAA